MDTGCTVAARLPRVGKDSKPSVVKSVGKALHDHFSDYTEWEIDVRKDVDSALTLRETMTAYMEHNRTNKKAFPLGAGLG